MDVRKTKNRATKNQINYINILSSYSYSKYEDAKTIVSFIGSLNKRSVEELTKDEASQLIKKLLEIPTDYEFPCGKRKTFPKEVINKYNVFGGELEACIHECDVDVNDCPFWQEEEIREHKEYVAKVIGEIIYGIYEYKCANCGRYIIPFKDVYDEVVKIPNLSDKVVYSKVIHHHINYEKDITVYVCSKCHAKIHRDKNHPLYPVNK